MTWFILPADAGARLHEAGYLADPATATTAYLAGALEKPLLVEGPAGVGKTELAKAVSRATGAELVRLQCYEGLDEARALYEWNYKKQLLRIQASGLATTSWAETHDDIFTEEFLLTRPLLTAIRREEPTVLLIDEVDKTDVEVEGLLLEVLSDFQVTIPELGTVAAIRRPFVVLTSNASRELSEAVKRRCLYLHLDYPDAEREREIVTSQVPDLDDRVAEQLVATVGRLRELELKKAPSIAESVDWARTLIALEIRDLDEKAIADTLGVDPQARLRPRPRGQGAAARDDHDAAGWSTATSPSSRRCGRPGLPVSLAEDLDAIAALRRCDWGERPTVRDGVRRHAGQAAVAAADVRRAVRPLLPAAGRRRCRGGRRGRGSRRGRRARQRRGAAGLPRRAARGARRRRRPAGAAAAGRRDGRHASARCPAAVPGCRRGRRTPPCSGSRRRSWSTRSSQALLAEGRGEEEARRVAGRRVGALHPAWSRTTPAAGSRRRRGPTTSPTSRSGRRSTGSTSPPRARPTWRRCGARSTRSPAGWRPG